MNVRKSFRSLCVLASVLITAPAIGEPSLGERYPAPWREDFNVDITKALVAKGITGCGEYKYRASTLDRNEYLVYCTHDGKNWTAYFVWPRIKEVMGPYAPDPSVK